MGSEVKNKRILQIGFGAFGETHAAAWSAIGCRSLTIADPNPAALARAAALFPWAEQVADWRQALAQCQCVDILTPTDTHHSIAAAALDAGKDLFIEKPATVTAAEAADLLSRQRRGGSVVQCGLYYRHHPKALALKAELASGRLGRVRLMSGRFAGIKRARRDSGALHNDAVHFIDLFNWLSDELPQWVHAVTADHFARGLDDMAILQLGYPSGAKALIETGYAQPGRWADAVVPGAITSKEIAVSGTQGIAEVDFAAERFTIRRGSHRQVNGLWQPEFAPPEEVSAAAASAIDVLASELRTFLGHVASRSAPETDLQAGGLVPARIIEAAIRSAENEQTVQLVW